MVHEEVYGIGVNDVKRSFESYARCSYKGEEVGLIVWGFKTGNKNHSSLAHSCIIPWLFLGLPRFWGTYSCEDCSCLLLCSHLGIEFSSQGGIIVLVKYILCKVFSFCVLFHCCYKTNWNLSASFEINTMDYVSRMGILMLGGIRMLFWGKMFNFLQVTENSLFGKGNTWDRSYWVLWGFDNSNSRGVAGGLRTLWYMLSKDKELVMFCLEEDAYLLRQDV